MNGIKPIAAILITASLFLLPSCAAGNQNNTAKSSVSTASKTILNNLTWKNTSFKDGDDKGPCYCLYSSLGFNKVSADINLSSIKTNLIRKSDKKALVSYIFLGIEVNNGDEWANCADIGLCNNGDNKWHAVINRYTPKEYQWYKDFHWWESNVILNNSHDYRIAVDCSKKNESFTLQIIDITDGEKIADSKTVDFKYAKSDGSNTLFYRAASICFPDNVCKDPSGAASTDYVKVLNYNTEQGVYMKNVHFSNIRLFKDGSGVLWNKYKTKTRFLWPESKNGLSYACTRVNVLNRDYEDIIDIDLNKA